MRVAAAVQHHPSRADLIPALANRLDGLDVDVVADTTLSGPPSPWRTYQECLRRLPDDASHLLVIQDDAVPCGHFAEAVHAAVAARPDRPIALWVGGAPADACAAIRQATKQRRHWIDLSPWTWFPCVASVWPRDVAIDVLVWAEEAKINPLLHRGDDGVLARFMQRRRIWPVATVPSLVEHPDVAPSTIGRKARAGVDKGRVACVFIGDGDPRAIQW